MRQYKILVLFFISFLVFSCKKKEDFKQNIISEITVDVCGVVINGYTR